MTWLILAGLASAQPVEGGIQAAVFQGGFDLAETFVRGTEHEIREESVSGPVGCWDEVGVQDFNLVIPIDDVQLDLRSGGLMVDVSFGQIYGEQMVLYTVDADYVDACTSDLEFDVLYVLLDNAHLSVEVAPAVRNGSVFLEVIDEPTLTGQISSDIDWVPDDLLLGWFEGKIFDAIENAIPSAVADISGAYLDDWLKGTSYGDWDIDLDIDDATVLQSSMELYASVDARWRGDDGCPRSLQGDMPAGRNPDLNFGTSSSTLALGLTEAMLNEQILTAWTDGYFCFTNTNTREFLDTVQSVFDPDVVDMQMSLDLDAPPRFAMDERGIGFDIPEVHAEITASVGGQRVQVLDLRTDVAGVVELALDDKLASVTMSVHGLQLDIASIQAEHLLSDNPDAAAHLEHFLEDFVAGWVADQTKDVVLFNSAYYAMDLVIGMDALEFVNGGVKAYATVYDKDDPAVDRIAPQTSHSVQVISSDTATVDVEVIDDREGLLVSAYRIDGGSYSPWSDTHTFDITGLPPGRHEIEIIGRDQWFNIDPSPSVVRLEVTADGTVEDSGGCDTQGGGAPWLAVLLAAVGLRRRRV